MLEEKEKKLVYSAIAAIIVLLIIVIIIIWTSSFSNKDIYADVTSVNQYNNNYYVEMKKENYKNVVVQCINEDNFEDIYKIINNNYLLSMNMDKDKLEKYLKTEKILSHPTNSTVIYCSNIKTNGEEYVYTYVYRIGSVERKIHIIESYINKYTVSFEQDSYPVVDNKIHEYFDSETRLKFNIQQVASHSESLTYEIEISNNTTEEYTFDFSSIDDSNLVCQINGETSKASLASIVVGNDVSNFTVVPGASRKVKLSYGINLDKQDYVIQLWFNNVKNTNGDKMYVATVIK